MSALFFVALKECLATAVVAAAAAVGVLVSLFRSKTNESKICKRENPSLLDINGGVFSPETPSREVPLIA